MGLVEILLIGIAIWICIYSLFERVCKCKESCAIYNAYAAFLASRSENSENTDIRDFLKTMTNVGGNNTNK